MADTSWNLQTMIRSASQTQAHQQHRIQLSESTFLVLGQGEMFRHVNPDDFMWTDQGERHLRVFIPFTKVMRRKPVVQVNLVGVDASHAQNLRLKLTVSDATTDGFIVTAHTWQDTKLASVDVSWMAFERASPTETVAAVHTLNSHKPS